MQPFLYVGQEDRLLDFPDSSFDFRNAEKLGKSFKMVMVNSSGVDQELVIIPNDLSLLNRTVVDGVIPIGGGVVTVSATSRPSTIAQLRAFLKRNPTQIIKIDVASDNTTQLTELFKITRANPFKGNTQETVDINSFKDKYQQDNKSAVVTFENLDANGDTELALILPGSEGVSTTTTLTITFGVSLSTSYGLAESRRLAMTNLKK